MNLEFTGEIIKNILNTCKTENMWTDCELVLALNDKYFYKNAKYFRSVYVISSHVPKLEAQFYLILCLVYQIHYNINMTTNAGQDITAVCCYVYHSSLVG